MSNKNKARINVQKVVNNSAANLAAIVNDTNNVEVVNEQNERTVTSAIASTNKASIVATTNVLTKLSAAEKLAAKNNDASRKQRADAIRTARAYNATLTAPQPTAKNSSDSTNEHEKKYTVNNVSTNNKHMLAALYLQLFFSEKIRVNGITTFNELSRLNLNYYFVNSGFAKFVNENNNATFNVNDIRFLVGKARCFAIALNTFRNIAFLSQPLNYKFAAERLKIYFVHSKTFDFIKPLQSK